MRSSIPLFCYLRKRSSRFNIINYFVFLVFFFQNGTKIQECYSKKTRVATSWCVMSVIKRFSRRFSLLSTLFVFTVLLALRYLSFFVGFTMVSYRWTVRDRKMDADVSYSLLTNIRYPIASQSRFCRMCDYGTPTFSSSLCFDIALLWSNTRSRRVEDNVQLIYLFR